MRFSLHALIAALCGVLATWLVYIAYAATLETQAHFAYLHTVPWEPRAEWIRVINLIQQCDARARVFAGSALVPALVATMCAGAEFARQLKRIPVPRWVERLDRPPAK